MRVGILKSYSLHIMHFAAKELKHHLMLPTLKPACSKSMMYKSMQIHNAAFLKSSDSITAGAGAAWIKF